MIYVGIDQSYSGFAVVIYHGLDGTFDWYKGAFPAKKYGAGIDRLQVIGDWLYALLPDETEHICMEGYSANAKYGREVAGELGAIVKQVIWQAMIGEVKYPTIVQPTLLKKYATGKGVAPKNTVLMSVYKRWGVEFTDDNLADAYTLARIAHAIENPSDETVFQQEVLKKLVLHTELRKED